MENNNIYIYIYIWHVYVRCMVSRTPKVICYANTLYVGNTYNSKSTYTYMMMENNKHINIYVWHVYVRYMVRRTPKVTMLLKHIICREYI